MTRIFLAASNELEADRRAFEQDIHRRNQIWGERGFHFQIDVWEDFDDSMSSTRKQDDYNAVIRAADIFVVLVHTKVGKYTREEFEAAWEQFKHSSKAGRKPRAGKPRIYTYFKAIPELGEPDPSPEYGTVRDFLARLSGLGHWPNKYDEVTQVLHHFGTQLERLWALGVVEPVASTASQETASASSSPVVQGSRSANVKHNRGSVITGNVDVRSGGGAVVFGAVETRAGTFTGRDRATSKAAKPGRAVRKR